MMHDVTVIGEIFQDHIFSGFEAWPSPGMEIFTDDYEWELGGGAVTTACALARLGRSVRLIGVVGQADLPLIQQRLAHFGVDVDDVAVSALRTGVTVSISTREERSFFTFRGANTELENMLANDTALLRSAADARHVHLAMPVSAGLAPHLLPLLRLHGATTSLDVGHHVGWLHDEASLNVLRAIDYTLPNAREASLLSGDPQRYLAHCESLGMANAVVKLGPLGAVMRRGGTEYKASSPDVQVLDTTGAGDVFDAGFIDALLDDASPRELLERGCVCGALSTRAAGALRALPTRAELQMLLQENYAA